MPTPTSYTYSIANDFPPGGGNGKANISNLVLEIQNSSIVTACAGVNTDGDVLTIFFKDVLSVADKTTLDGNATGPAGGLIATNNNSAAVTTSTSVSFSANISNDGTLNGTTIVTLIPAPATNTTRLVKTITINNTDTAAVILIVQFLNGSSYRNIWKGTLQPGDAWQFGDSGDVLVLDSTSKSIVASLSAPPATVNPDFTCCYGDAS